MNSVKPKPITTRQSGEFARLLEERGCGAQLFQAQFIEGIDNLMAWLEPRTKPKTEPFTIRIDYSEVERQMEEDRGKWMSENLFANLTSGSRAVEVLLVDINRELTGEEVIEELRNIGLRPANIYELRAFKNKYLDLIRKFPLAALGSEDIYHCPGDHAYPFYHFEGDQLFFNLRPVQDTWSEEFRFLALST